MIGYPIVAALAAAGLYGLHRLFLWMEQQGWVYYWHKSGSGNAGNVLMPIQAIYQPEVHYVIEERARNQAEQDESGDPPFPDYERTDETEEGPNR